MLNGGISGLIRRWNGLAGPHNRAADDRTGNSLLERLSDPTRHGSEELAGQLRARQVNAIQKLSIPLMIVNLVNIGAFLLQLYLTDQLSEVSVAWSMATGAIAIAALAKAFLRRKRQVPHVTSEATVRRVIRSCLLFGLLWAVPGLAILPLLSGMALAFATALLTGMIAGAAIVLYPVPAAAVSFVVPVAASGVAGLVWSQGWLAIGPAVLAIAFLYIFLGVVRRHAELFVSEFVARLDLEQRNRLIEDLLEDSRLELLGARRLARNRLASERTAEAVGRVTGGMAHQFNNLLTVLRGNAELLAETENTDRTLVRPILEACDRGAAAVQSMLAAAERQSLKPKPVPLDDLLGHLQQAFQASLGSRIQVLTKVENQPCTAIADRKKLENALFELIHNARQAIRGAGEIRITCRTDLDSGTSAGEHPVIAITVRDTGCGMDEATRRQAMEPFFTTRSAEAAHGLGLSAAAGFARQSGGHLKIESWPGAGTAVTLCLPGDREAAAGTRTRPGDSQVSVLVVESDAKISADTETMLAKLGYRVLVAVDAENALRRMSDANGVDLVLSNILLLGSVSGVQLGRMIQDRRPNTKLAFLSNLPAGRPSVRRSAPDGAVLAYPFTLSQLDAHLRQALAGAHALA